MANYEPFSGTERLAATPDEVYAFVTNLDELVKIVPGLVSSERVGDSAIKCSVRPGFSFIRTTLKQTFTIIEREPGKRVVMQVDASGIGTAFTVRLRPQVDGDHPEDDRPRRGRRHHDHPGGRRSGDQAGIRGDADCRREARLSAARARPLEARATAAARSRNVAPGQAKASKPLPSSLLAILSFMISSVPS